MELPTDVKESLFQSGISKQDLEQKPEAIERVLNFANGFSQPVAKVKEQTSKPKTKRKEKRLKKVREKQTKEQRTEEGTKKEKRLRIERGKKQKERDLFFFSFPFF